MPQSINEKFYLPIDIMMIIAKNKFMLWNKIELSSDVILHSKEFEKTVLYSTSRVNKNKKHLCVCVNMYIL